MLAVAVALLAAWIYFKRSLAQPKFVSHDMSNAQIALDLSRQRAELERIEQSCPQVGQLIKNGNTWQTQDGQWTSYTDSTASKVLAFLGAQWVGTAKVGQIMCMYKTDEAVAFSLNLEPRTSLIVPEPENVANWSARIDNRYRICRSANIADCKYMVKRYKTKTTEEIMRDIKWNPK